MRAKTITERRYEVYKRFCKEEGGQNLIESSLLLGFIALFSVSIYTTVTGNISSIWGNASSGLVSAGHQQWIVGGPESGCGRTKHNQGEMQ